MAIQNFSGFLAGAGDGAASTGGAVSVSTSMFKHGGQCLRVNPTGTGTGVVAFAGYTGTGIGNATLSQAAYSAGFWFRYHVKPASGDENLMDWISSSSTRRGEIRLNSSGQLCIYDAAGTLQATGSTVLAVDTWYHLEFLLSGSTSGTTTVYIDGVSEVSTTANFGGTMAGVQIGKTINHNGNDVDFFYDDFVFDTTTPVSSATVSSGVYVCQALPTSNAAVTFSGTGSGLGDYRDVDDSQIGTSANTDYLRSGAQNEYALFNFQSCTTAGVALGDGLLAVRAQIEVRNVSSTGSAFALRIKSSSTNSDNTNMDPTATFAARYRQLLSDPAAGLWTRAGVDAVQVGVVDNSTGPRCDLSQVTLAILASRRPAGTATVVSSAAAVGGSMIPRTPDATAAATAAGLSPPTSGAGGSSVVSDATAVGIATMVEQASSSVVAGSEVVGYGSLDEPTYAAAIGRDAGAPAIGSGTIDSRRWRRFKRMRMQ